MTNLLEGVHSLLTDDIRRHLARITQLGDSIILTKLDKSIATIIGGMLAKGTNLSEAKELLAYFNERELGNNKLVNLSSILQSDNKSKEFIEYGSEYLNLIFGKKQDKVLSALNENVAITSQRTSTLLKLLAPIVMNKLAGLAKDNDWDVFKLNTYLEKQRPSIQKEIPELEEVIGYNRAPKVLHNSSNHARNKVAWLKWLILPLIGVIALYFLTRNGCQNSPIIQSKEDLELNADKTNSKNKKSTSSVEKKVNTSEPKALDSKNYAVSDEGAILNEEGIIYLESGTFGLDSDENIIDYEGNVLIPNEEIGDSLMVDLKAFLGNYKASTLRIDNFGNLTDENGVVLYKQGEFYEKDGFYYDKKGNKLGKMLDNIVNSMRDFFNDLVSKKAGSVTMYSLNEIKFDQGTSRIIGFNKEEIEGLANALKQNKKGKVKVLAHTNEYNGNMDKRDLSQARAEVVYNMLVTLGVDKKQISFKGMGDSEDAKASNNQVEIVAD